ncbi:Translation initiation factor IF-2, variant 2 [Balamuthia mandrillaris]
MMRPLLLCGQLRSPKARLPFPSLLRCSTACKLGFSQQPQHRGHSPFCERSVLPVPHPLRGFTLASNSLPSRYYATSRGGAVRKLLHKKKKEVKEVRLPHFIHARDFAKKLGIDLRDVTRRISLSGVRFDKPKDVIFSWPTTAEFAEHLGITPIYDDVDLIRDTSRFRRRREGKAGGGEGELSAEELAEVLEREQRKGELVGESVGHRRAIQLKKAKKRAAKQDKQLLLEQSTAPVIKMEGRPGIVSVMGHVDHGKTTLLDSLRNTTVAQQEAGGITQQLTAFQVFLPLAKGPITFLDTPGHRAFFRMRSNGAYVSDLVLLIIAADEGIQSQTEESFQLAQESNIPVIIVINKIDLASSDLVIHQLRQKGWLKEKPTTPLACMYTQHRGCSQHHCSAEEGSNDNEERHVDKTTNDNKHSSMYVPSFTGQPICLSGDSPIKGIVEISAKQKTNLEILEGVLHKQIQHLELKANIAAFPEATVVETFHEDAKRGRVLSIILHCGVLRKGQPFICGFDTGIVRGIWDVTYLHKEIEEARPAQPVEITGLHINPFSRGSDIQLLPSPA